MPSYMRSDPRQAEATEPLGERPHGLLLQRAAWFDASR